MKDMPRTVSAPLVFSCLLVFLLSSSALGQSTSPRVTVWLYRAALDNFGSAMPLYVDGKKMVSWGPSQYFGIQLSPGLHAFSWTNAPGARQLVLPIAADAQSYLEVKYLSAAPFLAVNPLPADNAIAAMTGLRPIDSNAAFVDGVIIPAQRLQIPGTAALNGSEIASSRATAPAPKVADPAPAIAILPSASAPPPAGSAKPAPIEKPDAPTATAPRPKTIPADPPRPASPQKPDAPTATATRQIPTPANPASTQRGRAASEIKIHGYVTAVNSPTSFDIEDYRITRDAAFKLEFDNASPDLSFKIEDVRVGTELEIRGIYDGEKSELLAKSIKVDMEQFKKLKDTAVLDRPPSGVEQIEGAWRGIFFVNGQRIQATPETKVVFKLTDQEKKAAKSAKNQKANAAEKEAETDFRPLSSLTEITSGMVMTYEGKRDIETGKILADRVEFSRHEFEKGEQRLWERLKVKVTPGDAQGFKPGELSISQVGKFKLLPNEQVQTYVTKLGESLIPEYLKAVPDSDPAKLHFKFYVVLKKDPNAFALPNGVCVIHSGMFDVVENEAQLAAVIGHEIAHATQEHQWREMNYHKTARTLLSIGSAFAAGYGATNLAQLGNMIEGAIRNGYQRALENQADRIGLEYMVRAGYDPREAPQLWKQMTKAYGLQVTNIFWSTHDNQATRRSYLMNEIKNNYSEINYSQVKKDGDGFSQIRMAVKDSASGNKTIKVKGD